MELKLTISKYTKFCIVIILVRLFLASDMRIYAIPEGTQDDALFFNHAVSLYNMDWLGTYDQFTLAKGPFYSMFIALNHLIGLPLLLSQLLLYIAACLLIVSIIKKITNNKLISGILLTVLLFNPIVYADELTRILREGIYPAMAILTLFSYVKIFMKFQENKKESYTWVVLSGLFLSGFWLTKEDGIWLLPSLVFLSIYFLIRLRKERLLNKKSVFVFIAPFLILLVCINLICSKNKIKYGIYEVVEFKNESFLNAYGSLARVKPDTVMPFIPVTNSTRLKLYKVIPAFKEISDGEFIIKQYSVHNPYCKKYPITCGEVAGGWFLWGFRDAVAYKGYYENPQKVIRYYDRLTKEIDEACDSKKLDCYPLKSSLMPSMSSAGYYRTAEEFGKGWGKLAWYDGYYLNSAESSGTPESRYFYQTFTRNPLKEGYGIFSNHMGNRKMKVLKVLSEVYYVITFPFMLLSLVCIAIIVGRIIIKKELPSLLNTLTASLVIAVVSRMLLLALVESTSFPAFSCIYMSPIYPLLFAVICLSCYEVGNTYLPFLFSLRKKNN